MLMLFSGAGSKIHAESAPQCQVAPSHENLSHYASQCGGNLRQMPVPKPYHHRNLAGMAAKENEFLASESDPRQTVEIAKRLPPGDRVEDSQAGLTLAAIQYKGPPTDKSRISQKEWN
ncbi:MAG TPA: hypothetical protein VG754_10890 [Verrucomicrobiae bacterium]|nr:hypothetical protein [Verrucomicrobiae bacterium]